MSCSHHCPQNSFFREFPGSWVASGAHLFDIWRYFGTEYSVDLEDFYMLVSRALKTHSLTPLGGSLHFIWPCLGVQHSQFPSAILRRKFSSSSWNKFASATLSAARQSDGASERILQPAPALYPGSILSQKQKKVTAVVERALQATLTQAVSPPHLSPYIPYLSLSVLSISRDCYVVTIGWDCSGCNFSLADQHLMQVCGLPTLLFFYFSGAFTPVSRVS